jgi:hypothetical protein
MVRLAQVYDPIPSWSPRSRLSALSADLGQNPIKERHSHANSAMRARRLDERFYTGERIMITPNTFLHRLSSSTRSNTNTTRISRLQSAPLLTISLDRSARFATHGFDVINVESMALCSNTNTKWGVYAQIYTTFVTSRSISTTFSGDLFSPLLWRYTTW